jgi:MT-A70
MQAYAKQAKDSTLITQATKIRMRAERRAGEMLAEMKASGQREGAGGDRKSKSQPAILIPKLSDIGITATQSSRWQQLAALAPTTFEDKVEAASKRAYDQMTSRFVKAEKIERAKQRHSKLIEHGSTVDNLAALADSGKRFGVIYADPAWPWETYWPSGKIRSAPDNYYGTSPLGQIAKLPVARLAADDCALLLWCTALHIARGNHIPIIEAWGFKPSTVEFVWIKQNPSGERGVGCGVIDVGVLRGRSGIRIRGGRYATGHRRAIAHEDSGQSRLGQDKIWPDPGADMTTGLPSRVVTLIIA